MKRLLILIVFILMITTPLYAQVFTGTFMGVVGETTPSCADLGGIIWDENFETPTTGYETMSAGGGTTPTFGSPGSLPTGGCTQAMRTNVSGAALYATKNAGSTVDNVDVTLYLYVAQAPDNGEGFNIFDAGAIYLIAQAHGEFALENALDNDAMTLKTDMTTDLATFFNVNDFASAAVFTRGTAAMIYTNGKKEREWHLTKCQTVMVGNCGTANTYYIRCIDALNNANSSSSAVVLTYDAAKSATFGAGSQTITIGAGANTISW